VYISVKKKYHYRDYILVHDYKIKQHIRFDSPVLKVQIKEIKPYKISYINETPVKKRRINSECSTGVFLLIKFYG